MDGTQGYLPANYVEVSLTICKQCTVQYCSWSGETFHHGRLQCNVKGLELHCMTQYLSRNRVRNPLKNNPKIPTCAAQFLDHSMCHHCRDPALTMCSQCSPPLVLHQQVGNNIEGMTHLDNLYKIPIPSSPSLLRPPCLLPLPQGSPSLTPSPFIFPSSPFTHNTVGCPKRQCNIVKRGRHSGFTVEFVAFAYSTCNHGVFLVHPGVLLIVPGCR